MTRILPRDQWPEPLPKEYEEAYRERSKAKVRQVCDELGLPYPPVLERLVSDEPPKPWTPEQEALAEIRMAAPPTRHHGCEPEEILNREYGVEKYDNFF